MGSERQAVVQRLMAQRVLGLPLLGHVVERQHGAAQLAVIPDDRLAPRAPVAQLAVGADDGVLEAADDLAAQETRDRRIVAASGVTPSSSMLDAAPEPLVRALTRPRTAVVALENLVPEHDRALGVRGDDARVGVVDDGSQEGELAVAVGGGTGVHPARYRHVSPCDVRVRSRVSAVRQRDECHLGR